MNLKEVFEKYDYLYNSFDDIENKLSKNSDIHAILRLSQIVNPKDIIIGANHDELYLVTGDNLENATEDDIIELIRCGVVYNSDDNILYLFV